MKNIRIIVLCTLLVSLAIGENVQAQKPNRKDQTTSMGADGRMVAHPANWKTSMGADGRMITYPSNWKTSKDTCTIQQNKEILLITMSTLLAIGTVSSHKFITLWLNRICYCARNSI
jgi:hypothetical protein